jgi:hypothetical protein
LNYKKNLLKGRLPAIFHSQKETAKVKDGIAPETKFLFTISVVGPVSGFGLNDAILSRIWKHLPE